MTLHQHDPQRIIQLAERLLGSREKAEAWLDHPRIQLGGRTPREMLTTPDGVLRVEELLTQLDDDLRLGID
ncbi:MAG: MbcA/ParS/Xre antitoxin family protein [Burkholderiales bacterium]